MSYVVVALVIVAIIAIAPYVCRLRTGHRLVASILTGQFDHSRAGRQFSAWFKEHPAREEQRDLFVQLTLGLGCSSGVVADRLMHCVMAVWREQGALFGDMLAQEIDRLIAFDPPKDREQAKQQEIALQKLCDLKTRLRALDPLLESGKGNA
jgi:hypothetical protein